MPFSNKYLKLEANSGRSNLEVLIDGQNSIPAQIFNTYQTSTAVQLSLRSADNFTDKTIAKSASNWFVPTLIAGL